MKYIVEKRQLVITRFEVEADEDKEALIKGAVEDGEFIEEHKNEPRVEIIKIVDSDGLVIKNYQFQS